jgi:cholesterol 7-dehydrogenase
MNRWELRTIAVGVEVDDLGTIGSDIHRLESYPHPYPEGWYRLANSSELRRGDIRYIECLGGQFVLWREEDGDAVHLMDAYCPHLGASLALGRVRADCIECAFHLWRFTGTGQVAHIPYSDRLPQRVAARSYPVRDVYGQIFFYHASSDKTGNHPAQPPYELPEISGLDDGRMVYRGQHDAGRVGMHIIEFVENTADTAHFQPLHGQFKIPWTDIPVPGVQIIHSPQWMPDTERSWAAHLVDDAGLNVMGHQLVETLAFARVSFWGPGSVMTFRIRVPGMGEVLLFQTHLPVGPLEQQVNFRWYADRQMPRLLVGGVVGGWVSQWREDLEILGSKIYRTRPMLSPDDGPIHAMRRWYRQFLPNERSEETPARMSSVQVPAEQHKTESQIGATPRGDIEDRR